MIMMDFFSVWIILGLPQLQKVKIGPGLFATVGKNGQAK